MKALHDLRDMLSDELEEIARKPELSAGDLEAVHKLTDTIKNIDKICLMDEEGYSQAGDWEARGNYDHGSSYRRRRDSRGRYSRDSIGGYSNNMGYSRESMMDNLERMMRESGSEKEREALRRCMDSMR